jgi:ABC-type nitrate/sulfonate/bicarbonate transport system ATPase subunit
MSDSPLRLEGVSHAYGALEVLRDLDLEVARGEFLALVGPSGCGKTTLLNLLSGFLQPTGGSLRRHGSTRTVYQHDGLFPWLTVAENIALGLRVEATPGARRLTPDGKADGGSHAGRRPDAFVRRQASGTRRQERSELDALLALIHLEGFASHYPHQLSGGMRQRVELARALAGNTDVLLMDEPFSALDYQTRLRMRRELARMLEERPRTVAFVTHDIEEAAQLADRVVVLSQRPAGIVSELRLDVPRPRTPTHPVVVEAVQRILRELGLEEEEDQAPDARRQAPVTADDGSRAQPVVGAFTGVWRLAPGAGRRALDGGGFPPSSADPGR